MNDNAKLAEEEERKRQE